MDTPRSEFVSALEHFWNVWMSARKDVVLVICGSATSWIACEMKFSAEAYVITKKYAAELATKIATFRDVENVRKGIHLTFITANGLARNAYANSVQSEVTLDDLFRA